MNTNVNGVLYTYIDQNLVNSLHELLNCEIGALDCRVITTEYTTRVNCVHTYHLLCNALVHVIYSVVSGQCSYTIPVHNQLCPSKHTLEYCKCSLWRRTAL